MFQINVGQTKQFEVVFSDGVTNFPLPNTPLWTVSAGFGVIQTSGSSVNAEGTVGTVSVTGTQVGIATLRLSVPGYANVDTQIEVVLPPPTLRVRMV